MRAWLIVAAAAVLLAPVRARAAAERIAVHHQLSVHLDPSSGALEATDHVRLNAFGVTSFRLAPGLHLDHLVVDGEVVLVGTGVGGYDVDLRGHRRHDLTVRYHGVLAASAGEDSGLVVGPTGTFLTGDGWYPSFETDVLSYELTVAVPAGQFAVAPGKVLSEHRGREQYTARFASEGPMQEIALFAGPYRIDARRDHGRRLRTYLPPEVSDLAEAYLQKTADYITFYAGWIGAYPYSVFDVVSGPQPLGLGFPGLTYIGAVVLRLPFVPETSLGHEVLHNWWGNAVLVDASRGNWAEGLTTFMADYTYEERKGEAAARDMRLRWMREYAALPAQREQPLTAFRSRRHTASQVVGYHKAAMAFLMLRDEIGRAVFDRGIRQFWRRNRFRRAGWDDLRQAFARVQPPSRQDSLESFFSQWVERTGAPMLELSNAAVRKADNHFVISFVLAQQEPAYELRVPLVLRDERGDTTTALRLDAGSRRYELRAARRPNAICVDPDFRLFRRPRTGEVAPIVRTVVFDNDSPTVIAAADPQAQSAARALAAQLLEREPRLAATGPALPDQPALLIGTDPDVEALLARQVVEVPARIAGHGTARVWASARAGKGVLVVVTGRDATALNEMVGPLPHYGGESFVVFNGRRAIDHGVWPSEGSPLCADLPAEGQR